MGEGRGHCDGQVFMSPNMPGLATECVCNPGIIRRRVPDPHAGALLALLFDVDERQCRVVEDYDDNVAVVFYRCLQLPKTHHQTAVASERHHRSMRLFQTRGNGGRQCITHCGEAIGFQHAEGLLRLPCRERAKHVRAGIHRGSTISRRGVTCKFHHTLRRMTVTVVTQKRTRSFTQLTDLVRYPGRLGDRRKDTEHSLIEGAN